MHKTVSMLVAVCLLLIGLQVSYSTRTANASAVGRAHTNDVWLIVDLELYDSTIGVDGVVRLQLLRTRDWVEELEARIGGTVSLEIEELDLYGPALVLAIRPYDEPARMPGRRVTSTISSAAAFTHALEFEDQQDALVATAGHPIFSATREAWVRAEQLQAREYIACARDNSLRLLRNHITPGARSVFNIEVEQEHEYFVTTQHVRVHNAKARRCRAPRQDTPKSPSALEESFVDDFQGRKLDVDEIARAEKNGLLRIKTTGPTLIVEAEGIMMNMSSDAGAFIEFMRARGRAMNRDVRTHQYHKLIIHGKARTDGTLRALQQEFDGVVPKLQGRPDRPDMMIVKPNQDAADAGHAFEIHMELYFRNISAN